MEIPRICPARWLADPYDMFHPFYDLPSNYFRPWRWHNQSISKEFGSTIENEKGNYKISLDVQHFRPEEINVKVTDTEIIVEGKHEERPDTHGFITRQFKRRYAMPSHCASENVTSTMSSDGVLTIIAEKKNTRDLEKIVPIKICGASARKTQITCTPQELSGGVSSASSSTTKTFGLVESSELAQKNEKKIDSEISVSSTNTSSIIQKEVKNKDNEEICKIKNKQIMLKEDHSRLLRPELLKEANTETNGQEVANKPSIDLMQTTEKIDAISSKLEESSNKIKESLGKSSLGMSELTEQLSLASTSERSEAKGLSQMLIEQSSSSYKSSSTSSSMKVSGKASECVSDIISAELREAAENV